MLEAFYEESFVAGSSFMLYLDCDVQGFLQSNEVHIFGYARTKISDDDLRDRIKG